jgi:hydroxymethylglutaryl-CoA reductase (NADPH)
MKKNKTSTLAKFSTTTNKTLKIQPKVFVKQEELSITIEPKDKFPKFGQKDYLKENVSKRLEWLQDKLNIKFEHLGKYSVNPETYKGNIENLIGSLQVPVGITGPILINGEYAKGFFYVPFATTEGAIVTTYNIGMRILSQSGGVRTTVIDNGLHISPAFKVSGLIEAKFLKKWIEDNFSLIKKEAESTTNFGKLISINYHIMDRMLVVQFNYNTGDAQGMNMINVATEKACKYIANKTGTPFHIRSNFSSVKKYSAHNIVHNFGKTVLAETIIPRDILKKINSTPEDILNVFRAGFLASSKMGTSGVNCQATNAISAIFLACGQDIADISTSHVAHANCELTDNKDLFLSIFIPSLLIGTVGGGTGKGTQKECLEILGCSGSNKVLKFAEIIGATCLAGEIATAAAIGNGNFVEAHASLGRNRPSQG